MKFRAIQSGVRGYTPVNTFREYSVDACTVRHADCYPVCYPDRLDVSDLDGLWRTTETLKPIFQGNRGSLKDALVLPWTTTVGFDSRRRLQ